MGRIKWSFGLILIYEVSMRFCTLYRDDKIYLGKRMEEFYMMVDIFSA